MRDSFGQLVTRLNVRAMFLVALMILALCLLAVSRRHEKDASTASRSAHQSGTDGGAPSNGAALELNEDARLVANLFDSPHVEQWVVHSREAGKSAAAPPPDPEATAAPAASEAAPLPRPSVPVPLIYQGMMTRTSGAPVAMLAHAVSWEVLLWEPGSVWSGYRVEAVTPRQVDLIEQTTTNRVTLALGEQTVVQVRNHD